ncbi:MAG: Maf family nucleotide pyrophosphatase [Rhodospirillales bacterium]|nr:Maf family nucleotide pyrophosphatase [Rhodospirillales bacterium]MCW9039287.1 Maf family nucleotide pyrophosphatase [Rhodospirillales bacterium]
MIGKNATLVLASASSARARLLTEAGLIFSQAPAHVDESAIKDEMAARGTPPEDVAMALSEKKALKTGAEHPGTVVIGADQMLECGGRLYDKPMNRDDARRQLRALRGNTHRLISAVCIVQEETVLWRHVDHARMTMRNFSDGFLEQYLERAGQAVLGSVGVYHLEGLGMQLFEKVDGDYFTVLGLPMLPLLGYLREKGVIDS